jgi:hypothetical protein
MTLDRSFVQLNRASTERIRGLVKRLSEKDLQHPMPDGWTVAIALAHLAFWDRRVLYALDSTEREGKLVTPQIETFVNDVALPLFAAIPPSAAARLAVETAQALDKRLEAFREDRVEELYNYNKRWVVRALHRGEHLDDVDAALKS